MAHVLRTIAVVIFFVATGTVGIEPGLSAAGPSPVDGHHSLRTIDSRVRPTIEEAAPVDPLADTEQALVAWAKGRFAEAGLELPELVVRFDPTREQCNHQQGRFQQTNGERIVTICTPDSDTFGAELDRRRTLLHEFGHAWDFANLSDDDRSDLAKILGSDAWNDADAAWADRGVERFAETFVFALLDQPLRQLKVDLDCSDLLQAFHTATGAQPLGPGLPPCAA